MSVSEDLINFDIIEIQKENIQALPQGRSAKALASAFAASPFTSISTPGTTRNLNDTFRAEYEAELQTINDSDDPLDIYDRYVKWTFNAYPTAQATPESQLRPLLERATRAFQSTPTYKNDPRYLKLWIHYIRLFSDAPREIFAYLSRHGIGEGLALYYEEFAAWLEGAGRWNQAEEIYKLGIEREARPSERLLRKFGEFQKRYEARPVGDEPSSPALPTVRPALAAKLDPYATAPRTDDPQSQRLPSAATTSRSGKQKIAIFSDADGSLAGKPEPSDASRGWDNIGSIKDRKKENAIEAKPWAGETLPAGKKVGKTPKMTIFRDQSESDINANASPAVASISPLVSLQETQNPKTGKLERINANLSKIYPNAEDEFCFAEVMSKHRGWDSKDWTKEKASNVIKPSQSTRSNLTDPDSTRDLSEQDTTINLTPYDRTMPDLTRDLAQDPSNKPRRKKVMEVKGETQTVKLNLASPSGNKKVRRKSTAQAEPTMTLHSRAATGDVLDMFNQTLKNVGSITEEPNTLNDSDYDDEDYTSYTSGGESTGTGRASASASEFSDDTEAFDVTTHEAEDEAADTANLSSWTQFSEHKDSLEPIETSIARDDEDLKTPTSPIQSASNRSFLPSPPQNMQAPTRPYRDPEQINQNRLPFMTPIVEMTESSIGAGSTRRPGDYFSTKTPSRRRHDGETTVPELEDLILDENTTDFQGLARVVEEETQDGLTEIDGMDIADEKAVANAARRPIDLLSEDLENTSGIDERTNSAVTETSLEQTPAEDLLPSFEQLSILETSISQKPTLPRASFAAIGKPDRDVVIFEDHVNPIDEEMRQKILTTLSPSLQSYPGYHEHKPSGSNIKPELEKLAKVTSRKSRVGGEKEIEPVLHLSETDTVTAKQLLGRGGWATVFLVEHATAGKVELQAMKSEFQPSAWEYSIMTLAQARLQRSPQVEIRRSASSIATPLSFHSYADAGYMFESFHEQGNLLELVNKVKADALPAGSTSGASNPGVDEHLAMFFAVEILRTVSDLHAAGILHCDIKSDNFLVRLDDVEDSDSWSSTYSSQGSNGWASKGIVLIDFGRAIDTLAFKPDTCFYAEWATDKHDCPEQREARPWTYQADLWGIASIVSVLLFGKVLEETIITESTPADAASLPLGSSNSSTKRYKPRDTLKRYWQTELWTEVFDVLMNPAQHASQSERVGRGTGGIKGLPATKLKVVREKLEVYLEENSERKGLKQNLKKLEEKLGKRR